MTNAEEITMTTLTERDAVFLNGLSHQVYRARRAAAEVAARANAVVERLDEFNRPSSGGFNVLGQPGGELEAAVASIDTLLNVAPQGIPESAVRAAFATNSPTWVFFQDGQEYL